MARTKNNANGIDTSTKNSGSPSIKAPDKMQLLFTVVNKAKTDFYVDLLQNFEVNFQTILHAQGTARTEALQMLGLNDSERSVIISVIRKDMARAAMDMLGEKFKSVKNGSGIAYTVPLTSTIGVAIYQFLSNKTGGIFG